MAPMAQMAVFKLGSYEQQWQLIFTEQRYSTKEKISETVPYHKYVCIVQAGKRLEEC